MVGKLKEAHVDYIEKYKLEMETEISRLKKLLDEEKKKLSGAAADLEAELNG